MLLSEALPSCYKLRRKKNHVAGEGSITLAELAAWKRHQPAEHRWVPAALGTAWGQHKGFSELPVLLHACCLPRFSSLSVLADGILLPSCLFLYPRRDGQFSHARKGVSTYGPDCAQGGNHHLLLLIIAFPAPCPACPTCWHLLSATELLS